MVNAADSTHAALDALAPVDWIWQGDAMDIPPPKRRMTMGGGVLLALGAIAGAFAGASQGQPSLGLIVGLVGGAGLAVAVWLRDRAR